MNISADRYGSPWRGSRGQEYHKKYTRRSQEDVPTSEDKSQEKKGTETFSASEDQTEKTCREQILEKMAEMAKKVKDGTVEPTFQIGAMSFTMKEWDKLLEKFDAAEDALEEALAAQIEEVEKQAVKEALRREAEGKPDTDGAATAVVVTESVTKSASAGSVASVSQNESRAKNTENITGNESKTENACGTAQGESETKNTASAAQNVIRTESIVAAPPADETEEMDAEKAAALLTDEVTKCSYPTDDPKQKHWFITAYGKDGISCKEAYFDGAKWVNKDCWSLSYTEEGQYEKVMAFLQRFPSDANLRFAAHENFWKDFLAGEIDEDDFAAFFATTKDGVPDYTYSEGGSTYIDREKAKYAKYMNDFGAHFYTAEEMELIQRAILAENKKGMKPLSDYDGAMAIPGNAGRRTDAEDDLKTQITVGVNGAAVLRITTPYKEMEIEISEAQKWGLTTASAV